MKRRAVWLLAGGVGMVVVVAVALGVGLGLGLRHNGSTSSAAGSSSTTTPAPRILQSTFANVVALGASYMVSYLGST